MTLLKQKISWQLYVIIIFCLVFVFCTGFLGLKLFDSLNLSIEQSTQDMENEILPMITKAASQATDTFKNHLNHIRQDVHMHSNGIKMYILYLSIIVIIILIMFFVSGFLILKRTINGMIQHVSGGLQNGSAILSYSSRISLLQPIIRSFNNLIDINNRLRKKLSIVPVPIIELDENYCIKFINDSGLDLLKLDRNAVLNQNCKEIIRSKKCEGDNCPCRHANQSGDVISVETRVHIGESENTIPVDFTVVPLK